MAIFLTDITEWMPLVRISLGVDEIDLPDATLNNTILVDLAEKRVTDVLPNWATHFVDNPSVVKMAAICFLASRFCGFCEKVIMALEYEGPYRSERQKIDWQGKQAELIAEAYGYMNDLDPTVTLYQYSVVIVSPATPLFEEV